MAQPLYRRYRTIRATMAETGQSFSDARKTRTAALRRSTKGRAVLSREETRRERQRFAIPGLPQPKRNRDYGPGVLYAVVVKCRFYKIVNTPRGPAVEYDTRFVTLVYETKPSIEKIQHDIAQMYEDSMDDSGPMGESDVETDWYLDSTGIVAVYRNKSR